jgi:hypothetical protein
MSLSDGLCAGSYGAAERLSLAGKLERAVHLGVGDSLVSGMRVDQLLDQVGELRDLRARLGRLDVEDEDAPRARG